MQYYDAILPVLAQAHRLAGISDYLIYFNAETNKHFVFQKPGADKNQAQMNGLEILHRRAPPHHRVHDHRRARRIRFRRPRHGRHGWNGRHGRHDVAPATHRAPRLNSSPPPGGLFLCYLYWPHLVYAVIALFFTEIWIFITQGIIPTPLLRHEFLFPNLMSPNKLTLN